MQETQKTWVRSLGEEELLEKETGNQLQYSGLESSMARGAGQPSPWGCKESDRTEHKHLTPTRHLSQRLAWDRKKEKL